LDNYNFKSNDRMLKVLSFDFFKNNLHET
jgi:hypothetical protein